MKGERIVFIDYIRVVACFMVMLVHASENFYGADSSALAGAMSMLPNEASRFWVAFYDGFLSRTCVPLFMIVSAYLLVPLREGQTMCGFYRRRFTRILPPMFAFMFIYSLLPLAWGAIDWEQSLADLKRIPFNFPSMAGHLWFMYPLIGLYLIIPVISPWLEKASPKEEKTFLALFILSTFIPWLHRFVCEELWGECFWNGFTALWYVSGYLGYLVLAHYIRVHLKWSRSRKLWIGGACFMIGSAFTLWSFWYKGVPGVTLPTPELEWAWEFCTPNVLLATFGIFLVFSCIRQQKAPAVLTSLSKLSFGMYLVHLLFLAPIAGWILGGSPANPLIHVSVAIPSIAILTFLCSAVTCKLISFIPGSKWLIG